MMFPALVGAIGASLMIVLARFVGMHRDASTYAVSLIAISGLYVLFAIQSGSASVTSIHTSIALAFTASALVGYAVRYWVIAIALGLHGVFDIAMWFFETNPAPSWWGPFCFVVDIVLAAAMAFWLWRGVIGKKA